MKTIVMILAAILVLIFLCGVAIHFFVASMIFLIKVGFVLGILTIGVLMLRRLKSK